MFRTALAAALLLAVSPAIAQPPPPPPPPPPHEIIGRLQQRLPAAEAETFAGLWMMPNQRDVTVAFTRNAAATLAKYTKDPRFKPLDRPGPSLREMEQTQDHLMKALQRLGARPVMAGVDIREGRVEIEVVGDMTAARAAIARGELKVPPYVRIVEPRPLTFPEPAPPPPGYLSPVKAFPRVNYRSGGVMTLELRTGRVILGDEGCLRLEDERHSPVIVWPNEAALDLSHGDIRVFDRMGGTSIRAGETIVLGGSSHMLESNADVIDENPACPGPYFRLTGFSSYAKFQAEVDERRATELAAAEQIPVAEARRRLQAIRDREARLTALGEQLRRQIPGQYAGIVVYEGKARLLLAEGAPASVVPLDLAPYVTVERAPRPLAVLETERNAVLDQAEAADLKIGVYIDNEAGRLTVTTEDILPLARAAAEGRIALPDTAAITATNARPAGFPGEWNMEAAWKVLESAPDFAQIRALVAATDIPFYGEAPRKPSANGATDMARWLVMLGFTADEITALRAQGIDPVIDWEAQNGRATLENRAVLADHVVVGEVISVDPNGRALNDGHRTTVRFKVAEALKGAAAPGQTLTVRLVSGFDPDGAFSQETHEPLLLPSLPRALKAGDRYLLFLSHGQYANLARHSGYKPAAADWYAMREGWALLAPDGAVLGRPDDPFHPATLEEARRRLAPVQAKFRAAGIF